jgi:hypothetical protein
MFDVAIDWLPLKLGNAVCLRSAKLLDIFSHLNCKNFIFKYHFYSLSEKKFHHEDIRTVLLQQYYKLIFIRKQYIFNCGSP